MPHHHDQDALSLAGSVGINVPCVKRVNGCFIGRWARMEMKYLIVIEQTDTGYSAFSPDLHGCVATGGSQDEVEKTMQEVIQLHLEGLREDGADIPESHSYSKYLDIPA